MAYIQVLGGLILLVFAGDFLVRGSVSAAQRSGVPKMIIGLTIVAFGTSAPELVVGVNSVLSGFPTLALGNVVGSNIANIWLVLGVPAIIAPMVCTAPKFKQNMYIMLLISFLFFGVAILGSYTFYSGVLFLLILFGFLYNSGRRAAAGEIDEAAIADLDGAPETPDSYPVAAGLIIGGLVFLSYGADLLVDGSVEVARKLGVSEAVIGLTIVAIGTSIPELVTSIVAALRRHCDVAIGNVIGSNIFNILGIMGISSMFGEVPVPKAFLEFDMLVMIFASLTLLPVALFNWKISRAIGIAFTTVYVGYIFVLAEGATDGDHIYTMMSP